MAILGATTLMGIFTNSLIVVVNLLDKVKGKSLNPSDLILVTLGLSNVTMQFAMTANDFLSILQSDFYLVDVIYTAFNTVMFFPIFSSFWFTVCLCVYYCLQIVIFTHPFLIPGIWSTYRIPPISNSSGNQSLEIDVPKLSLMYLFSSNIIGCSIPLVLVGISNCLILNSLITNRTVIEKAKREVQSPRTEARERAARTVVILIFGSPKLKKALVNILRLSK
ncbi:hypothetical protein GDO86_001659 [Hymenochirus boettgeri]|uniref:Uncharacterized protein n=1 Tax=Hymenochirus boettgeri TaxID=247094 RepID=A0A8T2KGJ3_9PIPI|nr:hypothetical protein GDO86_001659 [Hymenochirus boettgeri]